MDTLPGPGASRGQKPAAGVVEWIHFPVPAQAGAKNPLRGWWNGYTSRSRRKPGPKTRCGGGGMDTLPGPGVSRGQKPAAGVVEWIHFPVPAQAGAKNPLRGWWNGYTSRSRRKPGPKTNCGGGGMDTLPGPGASRGQKPAAGVVEWIHFPVPAQAGAKNQLRGWWNGYTSRSRRKPGPKTNAGVVELVYTSDLKSDGPQGPYGFKSRPQHY